MRKNYVALNMQIQLLHADVITASGDDYVNFNPSWLDND